MYICVYTNMYIHTLIYIFYIYTHTHVYVYNVTEIGKISAKTYIQLSSLWSEIKQHVRGGVK